MASIPQAALSDPIARVQQAVDELKAALLVAEQAVKAPDDRKLLRGLRMDVLEAVDEALDVLTRQGVA